jgi:putative tricarboxylic transport membrane protein
MFVALKFTSWEMFLLALWGVVIAGNLTSGEQPLKGWIAGWLGMLVAMVGREVIFGADRFSFGSRDLLDGIDFVPLLIGLFGLAEVIRVVSTRESASAIARVSRVLPSWGMLRRYWKVAMRGSLIGAVIGCIPGGGANVATYVSYDVAKRVAPPEERERFGKGSYEAIVAAETADNANIGGALLPMLALGIPATAVSAMFMAALNLQGIRVGPLINQDHPGLLYIIYGLLIVANVIMYVSALLLIRPAVRIFSLPRELLMPIISVVCVVGAYEVGLSMFDVGIMYVVGILGYLLLRMGFPLAPMVLGAILGSMIDENLRRALMVYEGRNVLELVGRPLGLVIVAVILLTLWEGLRRGKRAALVPVPGDGRI